MPCLEEGLVVSPLRGLGLKQLLLPKINSNKKDVIDECLPRMNVLLMGHGSYKGMYGSERN